MIIQNSWREWCEELNTQNISTSLCVTQTEYNEFDLNIFRKHVYTEATKQLDMAYHQLKENKTTTRISKEETNNNEIV